MLVVAYVLVCRVNDNFELHDTEHVIVFAAGILVMSVFGAQTFGRFHGGRI